MAKRKAKRQPDEPMGAAPAGPRSPRAHHAGADPRGPVLIVGSAGAHAESARLAVRAGGRPCDHAATLAEARRAIEHTEYDVVVIDAELADGSGLALVREILESDRPTRSIVTSRAGGVDGAINAMRSGAADFIAHPFAAAELLARINEAARVADRLRRERKRAARLERATRRLEAARLRAEADAAAAFAAEDHVPPGVPAPNPSAPTSLAAEFGAIVRNELDVETLLRRTLEYVLKQAGSTNAAVFLPTGQRDYSLGAYVNCDVPRETAEVLLDHLADVLAPRLEHRREIVRPASDAALRDVLAEHAAWLSESDVIAFACEHDGECLAVIALFRDSSRPFGAGLDPTLDIIRRVFAAQMARVIRIHHRHRAEPESPGFEVDGWNDAGGLAA